jgi:hypothetical protein
VTQEEKEKKAVIDREGAEMVRAKEDQESRHLPPKKIPWIKVKLIYKITRVP